MSTLGAQAEEVAYVGVYKYMGAAPSPRIDGTSSSASACDGPSGVLRIATVFRLFTLKVALRVSASVYVVARTWCLHKYDLVCPCDRSVRRPAPSKWGDSRPSRDDPSGDLPGPSVMP